MGVRLVVVEPGHVEAEVPVEGNTNHIGTMYAGILFTVAEILGGAITASSFDASAYYPIVKNLTIDFRRPARSAVRASASLTDDEIAALRTTADAAGKADFTVDAEITDDAGVVVATTSGLYQLRRLEM